MPELPEVETIKRGLEKSIRGKIITNVILRRPGLREKFPSNLAEILIGSRINYIKRRAKYLLIYLDNNHILIIHLGMSGKLIIYNKIPEKFENHDHAIIEFSDKTALIYNDTRRFGLITIVPERNIENHKLFKKLGVEPFSEEFSAKYLFHNLQKRNCSVKQAIMDGKMVVGVGNIYASESLFRSKISPTAKTRSVTKKKAAELVINIREVLNEAIDSGGSTLRDYVRSDGNLGYFQHKFKVYGRTGKPCYICNTPIKKITQQGRSTFYCPKCQKD